MPEFDIGDYRIEVIDHARFIKRVGVLVRDILNRPRPALRDGDVLEQFDVRCFYQGVPLAWGSYGPGSDFPNEQHREIIEWIGREVLDVYNVGGSKIGTKRGADFRSRFWSSLMYQLRKAKAARDLGKTITDVRDAEIPDIRATFTVPVNLRSNTLDEAVRSLTGRAVQ